MLALGAFAVVFVGTLFASKSQLEEGLRSTRFSLLKSFEPYRLALENARWPAERHDFLFQSRKGKLTPEETHLVEAQILQVSFGFDYEYFLLRSVNGDTRVEIRRGALHSVKSPISILGEDNFDQVYSDLVLRPCQVSGSDYLCLASFPLERNSFDHSQRSYLVIAVSLPEVIMKAKYSFNNRSRWLPDPQLSLWLSNRVYPFSASDTGMPLLTRSVELDDGFELRGAVSLTALLVASLKVLLVLGLVFIPLVLTVEYFARRKVEERLELALVRNRLRHFNEVNRIVRGVIHDIRSPLSVLRTLTHEHEDVGARSLLDQVVMRMTHILRDLENKANDRCRAEEGALLPLHQLLKLAVREKQREFAGRIEIVWTESETPAWVKGDSSDFFRVVSNLVNNSVEASAANARVWVTLDAGPDECRLVIRDEGKGIEQHRLQVIREEGVTFGKENGTGYGLHQAQQTIERMGGSLNVTSQIGKGTQVTILLPSQPAPSWSIEELDLRQVTDLAVVDDEPSSGSLWERKLATLGKTVKHYRHPDELPTALLKSSQTLIVMDNTFGEEYGLGLSYLRKNRGARSILFTADWHLREVQEATRALTIPLCGKEFISELKVVV